MDVWLPSAYQDETKRAFPVLYMQDGQMVFDNSHNPGGGWNVHLAIERLANEEKITPPIVVAIPSTIERSYEYLPAKAIGYPGGKEALETSKNLSLTDENLEKSTILMTWIVRRSNPSSIRTIER